MRYADYSGVGLPIGSGVVEAACKTLVTQRMKNSGMSWGTDGGQAILTMRGWTKVTGLNALGLSSQPNIKRNSHHCRCY